MDDFDHLGEVVTKPTYCISITATYKLIFSKIALRLENDEKTSGALCVPVLNSSSTNLIVLEVRWRQIVLTLKM